MREHLSAAKRPTHLQPLAFAAAMLMAAQAQAQVPAPSFTQSGANSTSGNPSGLPFAGNPASLNFGTDTVYIANGAPGSFEALAGAVLQAGALSVANSGTGVGTFTATGINPGTGVRTQILLGGTNNRLEVGNWGTGTLTVSAGALLDATVNAAACSAPGASCFNFIGNAAGSTATLNVTGVGSEVRTLRGFIVGAPAVFTQAVDGFSFGTPGGTTNAFVNVLAGGKLSTQQATVGQGPTNAAALGTEKGFGSVVVDGAGSQWVANYNSIDNSAAGITIGNRVGGDGKVTVTNGGKLRIDGTGGPGPNDFLNIASNGGNGTLAISGIGSAVDVVGVNPVVNVGRLGASAQGSFNILAGATASTLYLTVGRDGATGTMVIDGIGSQLNQIGVNSNPSPNNGPAFANIGRDGGKGTVTVSNGGKWLISDGGGDGRSSGDTPGFTVGRGASSTGNMLITGPGSTVEVKGNSVNPQGGAGDNYNPFVWIGYDNAGTTTGTLTVEQGGKLILSGNSSSTVANARSTVFNVGGGVARNPAAGRGTATIKGADSELVVQGVDGLINVGRNTGSTGTLNVQDGAKVSSTSLAVGISGTGTVNIDNASIALSGNRTDTEPSVGAGSTFGRGVGGDGTLDMKNGASFTITPTVSNGGLNFGGDVFLSGGAGKLTMSGGSSIVVNGPLSGNAVTIGRTGTATADLSGESSITVTNGSLFVAREVGSSGTLILNANSVVDAGFVGVGVSAPGVGNALGAKGGTGRLELNNSTINTKRFELGEGSVLTGNNGIISAGVDGPVIIGGIVSPGNSPGRLRIKCDVTMLATSKLILEINDRDGGPGVDFDIDELIIGDDSKFDLTSLQIIFSFIGSTNPNEFAASEGGFSLDKFLLASGPDDEILGGLSTLFGNKRNPDTLNWGQAVNSKLFAFESSAYDVSEVSFDTETGQIDITASARVPEPASFALVLLALAAMGMARRRQAALRR